MYIRHELEVCKGRISCDTNKQLRSKSMHEIACISELKQSYLSCLRYLGTYGEWKRRSSVRQAIARPDATTKEQEVIE